MASKYGVEYTKAFVNVPSDKVDVSKWGGKLRVAYGVYDLTADLASGDKIYLARLPKGAIVYDVILGFSDLDATGGTVNLGYEYVSSADGSAVLDAWIAVADVTSAGIVDMAEQALVASIGIEMAGEANVVLSTAGDTDATSGTVKVAIFYSVE